MPGYIVTDWYWDVLDTNHGTHVFSSASGSFVVLADATYVSWLAADTTLHIATIIDTYVNLQTVISSAALDRYVSGGTLYSTSSITLSANTALSNPLAGHYIFSVSASGKSVTLPQMNLPTSLPIGVDVEFTNHTGFSFVLKDFAGNTITTVYSGEVYSVFNSSFSTTNGTVFSNMKLQGIQSSGIGDALRTPLGGTGRQSGFTLGDILYADATTAADGQIAVLAGNTTTTKKYLSQTGTGSVSAAPAWDVAATLDGLSENGMQLNGSMEISQENGTSAVVLATGTASYVIDMWQGKFVRAATLAISCQQVTPPGSPSFQSSFQKALQIKATTGLTPLATGDYGYLEHLIEGYRTSRLDFGSSGAASVTIGFWVYATIAGTMAVTLSNSAKDRSVPVNVTISSATTWEYKTVTFAGDTGGTWLFTTGIGLRVRFCFGAGATFQGTNNTWAGSEVFATSSTTNFFASTNNLACVTGVCVLPGTQGLTAAISTLIVRPYNVDYPLCFRYFYNGVPAARGAVTGTTSASRMGCPHPSPMRVVPTLTMTANLPVYDGATPSTITAIQTNYSTAIALELEGINAVGLTAGNVCVFYQGAGGNLNVDARL